VRRLTAEGVIKVAAMTLRGGRLYTQEELERVYQERQGRQ
jgi:hypothetical protein